MFTLIDKLLNKVTMYRLVLYYLLFLLGVAVLLSTFGMLPYNPLAIVFSAIFLTVVSWLTNKIFSRVWSVPTNVESVYITALILALIIAPARSLNDLSFLAWAAVWAMASKYILAVRKKHLFNPAAFAVALTALTLNQSANWWIATLSLAPFVLVGGLLITRKIRRFDMVFSLIGFALVSILGMKIFEGGDALAAFGKIFINTPILFFAFIMFTEPLTTPPTRGLRILYGALTGFLFAPWVHIGSIYSTPEIALLCGNMFAYLVSPKDKLVLKLKVIVPVAQDVYDFVFEKTDRFAFHPGQYLEWTLGHPHPDNRGNRRYFTIASAPTEKEIRIGIKFYNDPSSFKDALGSLNQGETIVASQLAGDFILPNDPNKKLAFIAGGIGVTPFRSMIKYLADMGERRSIVLFYANKSAQDIAYVDVFNDAARRVGVRTVYTITDKNAIPRGWNGETGYIDKAMIAKEIPDFRERIFYISGPHAMVENYYSVLRTMGIPRRQIRTDYFPGF